MKLYWYFNRGFIVGIEYTPDYTTNTLHISLGIFTLGIRIYK